MANIKGITIEIAGNTSKLTKALDDTKKQLVSTSSELKQVNKMLKFDPSNVTLLSQKQEILTKAIDQTRSRLSQLNELQQKFGDKSKLTEEQKEKYRLLEREIEQCKGELSGYEKEQVNVNNSLKGMPTGEYKQLKVDIDNVGQSALKTGDIIKANLISQAIISGVKKVGQAFKSVGNSLNEWSTKAQALEEQEAKVTRVMKNTTNASNDQIKSLINLTAKQEKLGVVSQETQLAGLQELGTYVTQKESLEKLLPVMNDMIAQQYGVGASMESASGIATMMGKVLGNGQVDALSRLGYKFDKTQQQVLKFGTEEEKVAMLTEIISQSVGGMNLALAQTDAGKMAIATSYMEDFQKTAGKAFSDFKAKVVGSFLPEIADITDALSGMLSGKVSVDSGMDKIVRGITTGLHKIEDNLPKVLQTGTKILTTLLQGITKGLPKIAPAIVNIVMELVECVIDNLPLILDTVLQVVLQVALELGKQLPRLIPKLVDGLVKMVNTILDNIDLFVDAAIQLVMGLADGMLAALPQLIEKIPEIIDKLIHALTENLPKLIKMGMELNMKLAEGLIKAIPDLVKQLPQIITSIVNGLLEGVSNIFDVGVELIEGLWEGIKSMVGGAGSWLWEKIKGVGTDIIDWFKGVFGIHSPSTVMAEQGKYLGLGLAEGIESTVGDVENAMRDLTGGVDASVNPTINPTANSNPLFITIEKFYNNRETDIQQLAEELEFYRKNSALARGGM